MVSDTKYRQLTINLTAVAVSAIAPFFGVDGLFQTIEQRLSAYFVLFIWSALFNGFNVQDEGGHIFRGLNANRGFLRVFAIIVAVQAVIVNAALVPGLGWLGRHSNPDRSCYFYGPAPQGHSGPAALQGAGAGGRDMKIS